MGQSLHLKHGQSVHKVWAGTFLSLVPNPCLLWFSWKGNPAKQAGRRLLCAPFNILVLMDESLRWWDMLQTTSVCSLGCWDDTLGFALYCTADN